MTATIATPAASPSADASINPSTTRRILGGAGVTGASLAGLLFLFVPRLRRRSSTWMLLLAFILPIGIGCGGSSAPKASLLAIGSSNIKAASGSPVTLTATLSALTSNPTGTVTFYDGTTAIGSPVPVTDGSATLQTSALAVGAHTITAVYSGDQHNGKSTSIAITQVITGSVTVSVTATSGSVVHLLSLPVVVE